MNRLLHRVIVARYFTLLTERSVTVSGGIACGMGQSIGLGSWHMQFASFLVFYH